MNKIAGWLLMWINKKRYIARKIPLQILWRDFFVWVIVFIFWHWFVGTQSVVVVLNQRIKIRCYKIVRAYGSATLSWLLCLGNEAWYGFLWAIVLSKQETSFFKRQITFLFKRCCLLAFLVLIWNGLGVNAVLAGFGGIDFWECTYALAFLSLPLLGVNNHYTPLLRPDNKVVFCMLNKCRLCLGVESRWW